MSDTKWTPGPWNAGQPRFDGYNPRFNGVEIDGPGSVNIALVYYNKDDHTRNETIANAHLCAAAPDLYAALADMLVGWRYIRETHGDLYGVGWDRAEDAALAALSKARGETA